MERANEGKSRALCSYVWLDQLVCRADDMQHLSIQSSFLLCGSGQPVNALDITGRMIGNLSLHDLNQLNFKMNLKIANENT